MMLTEDYGTVLTPLDSTCSIISVEHIPTPRAEVTLDKDELNNVIEFIELNFIESIRNDVDIDNIDYLISMMSALQKFRLAYTSIKLEEESAEINQEESK